MAISVRLQNEDGTPACHEDIAMEFALPHDEQYSLLRYIDPYGDTVFNQLQMKDFLSDWERLKVNLTEPAQERAWTEIREFACRCLSQPHLYLRFIGD